MKQRLPPLNALRAFEVAARHLSFAKAAEELCVTNAAVSHQIRLLEDEIGLRLFERRHNRLELTPAGEHYAPRVREGFRTLQYATDSIVESRSAVLRVAASPHFAAKWLVPRLYRFLNTYPEVRVEVADDAAAADGEASDLRIDDRCNSSPGWISERFAATGYVPVGVARYAASVREPADLARQVLLHVQPAPGRAHHPTWQRWFDELGLSGMAAAEGLNFASEALAFQAAIEGRGVMLGQRLLVQYDVAAGRLAELLTTRTSSTLSYYMISAERASAQPSLGALRHWLLEESRGREAEAAA